MWVAAGMALVAIVLLVLRGPKDDRGSSEDEIAELRLEPVAGDR
jgi:hypothetical protein